MVTKTTSYKQLGRSQFRVFGGKRFRFCCAFVAGNKQHYSKAKLAAESEATKQRKRGYHVRLERTTVMVTPGNPTGAWWVVYRRKT